MILTGKHPIVVTCARGIAPFLAEELSSLPCPVLHAGETAVEAEGSLEDAMRLNLHLRTAHRVLLGLCSFRADGPEELHRFVSAFPWEEILSEDGYFSVTSSVQTPSIRDSRFASLRTKDGIADRFYRTRGIRPDSGPARKRTVFHLQWTGESAAISLDTSGEPLSRRGYRKLPWKAPMQESLAAATILASRWDRTGPFVNPMCGSGTLAVEAALMALGRAPGLTRENFGFMHVRGYSPRLWRDLRAEGRGRNRLPPGCRILATDRDPDAVAAAKENARAAGVEQFIEFSVCPFEETEIPQGRGVIFLNPEYGERLGEVAALRGVYGEIGDFLKKKGSGYRGYVFTGNPGLAKAVGLKAGRRIPFFNGPIACRLLEYELYEGSLKAGKSGRALE